MIRWEKICQMLWKSNIFDTIYGDGFQWHHWWHRRAGTGWRSWRRNWARWPALLKVFVFLCLFCVLCLCLCLCFHLCLCLFHHNNIHHILPGCSTSEIRAVLDRLFETKKSRLSFSSNVEMINQIFGWGSNTAISSDHHHVTTGLGTLETSWRAWKQWVTKEERRPKCWGSFHPRHYLKSKYIFAKNLLSLPIYTFLLWNIHVGQLAWLQVKF